MGKPIATPRQFFEMTPELQEVAVFDFMIETGDPCYATAEIARWARWPYADVRNALKRMERKGIVRGKTIGVGHMNQRLWWIMP